MGIPMKKLAAAPAWLVFLVFVVGLPLLLHLSFHSSEQSDLMYDIGFQILWHFSMLLSMGWYAILGYALHKTIEPKDRLRFSTFTMCLLSWLFSLIAFQFFKVDTLIGFWFLFSAGVLIALLLLFTLIYIVYFISKCLVIAEKRRRVVLGDYFGTILLYVIYPIGVWWLQPRVKKVLTGTKLS
jgi:hypothetical protein